MPDPVLTRHPDPDKQGVRIDRDKYKTMRDAIVEILQEQGETSFKSLQAAVGQKLNGNFDGSIGWYYTTVKLDLEARGILARIPNSRPQIVQLRKNPKRHQ